MLGVGEGVGLAAHVQRERRALRGAHRTVEVEHERPAGARPGAFDRIRGPAERERAAADRACGGEHRIAGVVPVRHRHLEHLYLAHPHADGRERGPAGARKVEDGADRGRRRRADRHRIARERPLGEAERVGEGDLHPDPLADVVRDRQVGGGAGADFGLDAPVDADPAVGELTQPVDVGDGVGRRPQRLAGPARPRNRRRAARRGVGIHDRRRIAHTVRVAPAVRAFECDQAERDDRRPLEEEPQGLGPLRLAVLQRREAEHGPAALDPVRSGHETRQWDRKASAKRLVVDVRKRRV